MFSPGSITLEVGTISESRSSEAADSSCVPPGMFDFILIYVNILIYDLFH